MKKKVFIVLGAILLAALGLFFFFLPGYVGRRMNATIEGPPYEASERAKALHKTLLVADLHADTLMWDRDLLSRGDWGHVDLPRLVEGNVAAQAFTVVTKTPRGMNIDSNSGDTDNIMLLALAERWPITSWINLTERALYQARRLQEASARSNGKLVILRTGQDVTNFIERRKQDTEIVGGFLGLEGAHALEGDLNNLDRLYDAGFRMIGLAHFFDNEMAGSAHGVDKYGLTDKGRELVWRMEEKRVFIDLAHASPETIDNVLRIAAQPVIVSHTGVKGTCDNRRNLSDDQLIAIANTGGIVGIGFWDTAVCGRDAAAIAKAIRHAVNIMGVDHVALGSDYDGAVEAPFDATGVVQVTDALLREGFNEDEIRKIMGENVIRTLQLYLP
jgi:microsomal dipeptidase-like Zn-dependent dipeptidase